MNIYIDNWKDIYLFVAEGYILHCIHIHKLLKAFFSGKVLWEIIYWDKKRVQTCLYVSVTEFWFQSINPKVVIWLDWTMVWSVNELLDYHASLSCRSRMSFAKTDIKESVLGLYYTEIGYLRSVYMTHVCIHAQLVPWNSEVCIENGSRLHLFK